MRTRVGRWGLVDRPAWNGHFQILRNAASLMGTTAVTSSLGFVYWWVAARWFPAASVGLASALISAMTLLGTLGIMGLGTLLMGELPRQRRKAPALVTTALLIAGGISAVLGAAFAVLAPYISPDLSPLAERAGSVLLFALGTSLTAMGLVLDQAALGVMRGGLQLWRNTIFAVAKLAALLIAALWLASQAGLSIFATWIVGTAVSLLVLVILEVVQGRYNKSYRLELPVLQGLGREALQHHALNLVLIGPGLVLPMIVTALLSATTNAYFYTAFMMASFVGVAPIALTTVLFAAGSADSKTLRQKFRFTLALATASGLLAIVAVFLAGRWVLGFFGGGYAAQAGPALSILALDTIPLVITEHFVAMCRINRQPNRATVPLTINSVLKLALAAVGARVGGLVGLSIAVVAADVLVAAVLAPAVFRIFMGTEPWVVAATKQP